MKTFETPMSQIERIYAYFHDPAHSAEIQMATDKTQYVWQHMSNCYPTEQILRNGPIHELPERIDAAISEIRVKFSDGTVKTVEEYFNTSTMDAMLVLRAGTLVFERYKTMRPFDKHNWFSCTKSTVAISLALLEHEGKVDVSKPVSQYLPELAGSVWDTVTVEQTLDMATGLDSTEHEEADARTNPARGWYKWAMSIGVVAPVGGFDKSPVDVLRGMKRTKPAYEVFEYCSINTYICQKIVETVSQQPLAEFFGERVWRRIGAQNDGYLGLDKQGHALGFGFMNSTLRDLGRYGMIYTPSSKKLSANPIVPKPSSGSTRRAFVPRCTRRARSARRSRSSSSRCPGWPTATSGTLSLPMATSSRPAWAARGSGCRLRTTVWWSSSARAPRRMKR